MNKETMNKPLLSMSEAERENVLDEIGIDINKVLLRNAKRLASHELDKHVFRIAALLVTRDDGTACVVDYHHEHGDNEGWDLMQELKQELTRTNLIGLEDFAEVVLLDMKLPAIHREPLPQNPRKKKLQA